MTKLIRLTLFAIALTPSAAVASIPPRGEIVSPVTNDRALSERLSEIRIPRERRISFDADIAALNRQEGRFREALPTLAQAGNLRGALQRIEKQPYRARSQRRASLP